MLEIRTIQSGNLNCGNNYTISTTVLGVATSTQSTIFIGDIHSTKVFSVFGKTTGTTFRIDSVSNCVIKYDFSSNKFLGSLLSFLNIVNNNDGWAYSFAV